MNLIKVIIIAIIFYFLFIRKEGFTLDANVLKDKSIPLIPDSKGDNASKFIISFDVQEEGQLSHGTDLLDAGVSRRLRPVHPRAARPVAP